jgi:hypothetical protein
MILHHEHIYYKLSSALQCSEACASLSQAESWHFTNKKTNTAFARFEFARLASFKPMMLCVSNSEATHTHVRTHWITRLPLMEAEVLLFIVLWRPQFARKEARLVPDNSRMLVWESATGPELLLAVSNLNAQGDAKKECRFLIRSSLNTAPNL